MLRRSAAAIVFGTCTSTMASWKRRRGRPGRSRPAARSRFTWRSTAVFSPLIEKSSHRSPPSSEGTARRRGRPRARAGRAPARRGSRGPAAARPCRRPRRRRRRGSAQDLVAVELGHVHEHRVAAAHDQRHVRRLGRPVDQEVRPDVSLEVVHTDEAAPRWRGPPSSRPPCRPAARRPGRGRPCTATCRGRRTRAGLGRACSSSGLRASTWARAATSGTTPPKRSWRCSWPRSGWSGP